MRPWTVPCFDGTGMGRPVGIPSQDASQAPLKQDRKIREVRRAAKRTVATKATNRCSEPAGLHHQRSTETVDLIWSLGGTRLCTAHLDCGRICATFAYSQRRSRVAHATGGLRLSVVLPGCPFSRLA